MDIRKLQRAIVDGLEDVKAQNIVVFNTEALSPLFERVIVASGTSNRQTKALASSVRETVKSRGMPVMATEGEDNGEWIIVDCGAAVAHIMQPAIREYYHLEEIWGGKPVRLKAAQPKGLPKASEPASLGKSTAAKSQAGKTQVGKAGARKTAAGRAPARLDAGQAAGKKGGTATGRPARKAAARVAAQGSARPAKPAPAARKTPTRKPRA
jgi:ribosome-associated protein